MSKVTINIKSNLRKTIQDKLDLINNQTTMLAIYNTLAKKCDPYVPFLEGPLSQSAVVTADGVTYVQPYARYQYYGQIYGPNIPIKEGDEIIGWFSPPGQKKHPTGRPITYTKEFHPLATSFWDKAMMRDHGEEFVNEVENILYWRMRKLGSRR